VPQGDQIRIHYETWSAIRLGLSLHNTPAVM